MMYRIRGGELEVLLVHPGGPYWRNKDDGVWTIPKGELDPGEDELTTAKREFHEETGFTASGPFVPLGQLTQKSGKIVHAWAFAGDCDPASLRSNSFTLEWPHKSGRFASFPEVDRAGFFTVERARQKIKPAQSPLIDALIERLAAEQVN